MAAELKFTFDEPPTGHELMEALRDAMPGDGGDTGPIKVGVTMRGLIRWVAVPVAKPDAEHVERTASGAPVIRVRSAPEATRKAQRDG